MNGFCIFLVLLVASTIADGWSTVYWVNHCGDWNLTKEFNPLVRNTSLETMVWQGIGFTMLFAMIFFFAWKRREVLYPEAGYSIIEFRKHLNTEVLQRLARISRFPKIRLGSIILGICVPIAMIPMHFRAALTNILQVKGMLKWDRNLFLFVRVFEGFFWVLVGMFLIYQNYRHTSERRK